MSAEISKERQAKNRAKPFVPPKEPEYKKRKVEAGK